MNLHNFLYSGFKFSSDEDLLKFKFKMLNSIFIIVAFFSALFGLLSDLGINDLGVQRAAFLFRNGKKNH